MLILAGVAAMDGFNVEVFENVQDLGNVDAATAGRWKADDCSSAIGRDQRLAQDWLIGGKILGRKQTAVLGHPCAYGSRERTAIEEIRTLFGDSAIRAREV